MNAPAGFRQRTSVTAMCLLATGAGGAMDAWVYLDHGHVFANSQSGNVVLMAIAWAQGDEGAAAEHLPSLFAYLAGLFGSRVAGLRLKRAEVNSRNCRFGTECVLLLALAFAADHLSNTAVTAGVGLIAGIHITSLSHVGGWSFNTGMTTGNLRSLVNAFVAALAGSGKDRPHAALFAGLVLAFLGGALLGAWLTPRLHGSTLAAVATLVAAALLIGLNVPDPIPDWDRLE